MSSEEINEKIKRWVQPLKTTIAGIEIRDVHLERNTPLVIQGDLSSYMPSIKVVGKEVKNAEPKRD
jgi:hypothetical protein